MQAVSRPEACAMVGVSFFVVPNPHAAIKKPHPRLHTDPSKEIRTFRSSRPHGTFKSPSLTSDGPSEDHGGRTVMKGTPQRLHVAPQAQELQVLELVPVEVSAHVDALATDHDDLVAVQEELGHDGAESAHEMAAAIDDHRLKGKRGTE
jgi:hypothetical protein